MENEPSGKGIKTKCKKYTGGKNTGGAREEGRGRVVGEKLKRGEKMGCWERKTPQDGRGVHGVGGS